MSPLEIMFWLSFAHIVGDMVLQTEFTARMKGKHLYLMVSHILAYTGAIGIALHFLDMFNWYYLLWIGVGHFVIDTWKSKQPRDDAHFWQIHLDQGWHYVQLLAIVLWVSI